MATTDIVTTSGTTTIATSTSLPTSSPTLPFDESVPPGSACDTPDMHHEYYSELTADLQAQNYGAVICGLSPWADLTSALLECCETDSYGLGGTYHSTGDGNDPEVSCSNFIGAACRQIPESAEEAERIDAEFQACMLRKEEELDRSASYRQTFACFHPRKFAEEKDEEEEDEQEDNDGNDDEPGDSGVPGRSHGIGWGRVVGGAAITAILVSVIC